MSAGHAPSACYYCGEPGGCVARFRDGTLMSVCDEHMGRHLARAEAEKHAEEAERELRAADEAACNANSRARAAHKKYVEALGRLRGVR